jgi:hypothetical protein
MPDIESSASLQSILKSQYHAVLAMLRQAIERCPDELWAARTEHRNPFWRVAYHTLYFTHFYLQQRATDFRPWEMHQTRIHDLDEHPAPPEIDVLCELPHRPPQTGQPYTKEQLLAYWKICDDLVNPAVDAMDLNRTECGFDWYKISKAEHQIVNIRHIQHHAGQLSDRLRAATGEGIDWAGAQRS